MFTHFDAVVSKPWLLLGKILFALTGRSRYAIARFLIALAAVTYVGWVVITSDTERLFWCWIFVAFASKSAWRSVQDLERESRSQQETIGQATSGALMGARGLSLLSVIPIVTPLVFPVGLWSCGYGVMLPQRRGVVPRYRPETNKDEPRKESPALAQGALANPEEAGTSSSMNPISILKPHKSSGRP